MDQQEIIARRGLIRDEMDALNNQLALLELAGALDNATFNALRDHLTSLNWFLDTKNFGVNGIIYFDARFNNFRNTANIGTIPNFPTAVQMRALVHHDVKSTRKQTLRAELSLFTGAVAADTTNIKEAREYLRVVLAL